MRISDLSSDVCSSDLPGLCDTARFCSVAEARHRKNASFSPLACTTAAISARWSFGNSSSRINAHSCHRNAIRSEEHTSELQSLMRISYAVFCLKKKTRTHLTQQT